jgi:hypothetical protein
VCKACRHPERDRIDREIVTGQPFRQIAGWTGLSLGGLHRHREHVSKTLREAFAREGTERAEDLLDRLESLLHDAEAILASAKAKDDWKGAIAAIGAATRLLELVAKVRGEIPQLNTPGLHLTLNKTTYNVRGDASGNDDTDLALLVQEATKNWSPAEIERLRLLAENAGASQLQSAREPIQIPIHSRISQVIAK